MQCPTTEEEFIRSILDGRRRRAEFEAEEELNKRPPGRPQTLEGKIRDTFVCGFARDKWFPIRSTAQRVQLYTIAKKWSVDLRTWTSRSGRVWGVFPSKNYLADSVHRDPNSEINQEVTAFLEDARTRQQHDEAASG